MKRKLVFLKYLILCIFSIWLLSYEGYAQKRFLLNEADMPGFQLLRIETTSWMIRPDSIKHDVVTQVWGNSGIDECYISYSEFDSEVDAIKGTSCELGSYSVAFLFGSPGGEITGNNSWVSLDRKAVFFQKGNIGIKIVRPVLFDAEDPQNILNICNRVLVKINDSISTDILQKDLELLKYRLSLENYSETIKPCFDTLIENGFIETKLENSKWVIQDDSLQMGLRKQWSKEQSLFSIDVTRYSSDDDAQIAMENRGQMSRLSPCSLNDTASLSAAISVYFRFLDKRSKYLSAIGRTGHYVIHFYYFDENEVDINFFKRVVQGTSKIGTSIKEIENTGLKVYPMPANDYITIENTGGHLELYLLKLLDLNGREIFIKNIEFGNSYKINSSFLNNGTYLLKLENRNFQLHKLIIVKH